MSSPAIRPPIPYGRTVAVLITAASALWVGAGILLTTTLQEDTPRPIAMFVALVAGIVTVITVQLWCAGRANSRPRAIEITESGTFQQVDRATLGTVIRSTSVPIPRVPYAEGDTGEFPALGHAEPEVKPNEYAKIFNLGRAAEKARNN